MEGDYQESIVGTSESKIHITAKIHETAKISNNTSLIMDEDTTIGDFVLIACKKLIMARGSQINAGTIIIGRGTVILGHDSVVGYHCTLLTSTDTPEGNRMNDASPESLRSIISGNIELRDNAYIGSHSLIMPNVRIQHKSVIGAFSYISYGKDIPSGIIAWGQPAKLKRFRK